MGCGRGRWGSGSGETLRVQLDIMSIIGVEGTGVASGARTAEAVQRRRARLRGDAGALARSDAGPQADHRDHQKPVRRGGQVPGVHRRVPAAVAQQDEATANYGETCHPIRIRCGHLKHLLDIRWDFTVLRRQRGTARHQDEQGAFLEGVSARRSVTRWWNSAPATSSGRPV